MNPRTPSTKQPARKRPLLSVIVAVLIILIGVVQLLATAHTYAVNVGELNALKSQEAALVEKKEDIENDIKRWNDKAYVVSQARERLGFVFPGETSVLVLNADKLTDAQSDSDSSQSGDDDGSDDSQTLPWYKELQYSFEQADKQQNVTGDKFQNGSL